MKIYNWKESPFSIPVKIYNQEEPPRPPHKTSVPKRDYITLYWNSMGVAHKPGVGQKPRVVQKPVVAQTLLFQMPIAINESSKLN